MKNTKAPLDFDPRFFPEYLPETSCGITRLDTKEEIFKRVGTQINVAPYYWDNVKQQLTVMVSGKYFYTIPGNELSVYNLGNDNSTTPKLVKYLFKNAILTVKVMLDSTGNVYLSRKENMEDAIEYFKGQEDNIVSAKLNSITSSVAIFELGAGILGAVGLPEMCNFYVDSADDIFNYENIGKFYFLKLLGTKPMEHTKFLLSYKQILEPRTVNKGDCVLGKISDYTPDRTGVFVELDALTYGILDVNDISVYPSEIIAKRSEAIPTGRPFFIKGKIYPFVVKKVVESTTDLRFTCRLKLLFHL